MAEPFPMDPEELARAIDIPLVEWPGNCHGIACAVRDLAPVEGMRLARGHWLGDVSRKSVYRSSGVIQHSWLIAPDGRILDPTRWAILSPEKPSIYLGPNDSYDEGGRILASRMPPLFPGVQNPWRDMAEAMNEDLREELAAALSADPEHLMSLANRLEHAVKSDPSQVPEAAEVFGILERAGRKAAIPIDSWHRVMEPEKLFCRPGSNRTFSLPEAPELNDVEIVWEIFNRFLTIEERPNIEEEIGELGYSLDGDLWRRLNELEGMKSWLPMNLLPRDLCDTLSVIAGDLLGKGFGEELRVERFAASLGVDVRRLDALLQAFGERSGYDLGWHVTAPPTREKQSTLAM